MCELIEARPSNPAREATAPLHLPVHLFDIVAEARLKAVAAYHLCGCDAAVE